MTSDVRIVLSLVIVASATLAIPPALAQQDYPARSIRVIYPFAVGSGNDGMARLLSQRLTEAWGQPAAVENRVGAGGTVAAELVAKSVPDGYTLLFSTASLAVNATLFPKLPVDHLAPVSQINSAGIAIVVHPSVPARNLTELLALAKTRPDALNFGSNGTGTTSHLAIAWLQQAAGVRFTHVPYKGSTPALAAILGGEVALATPDGACWLAPYVAAGKLRAIAVTTLSRSKAMSELPTVASMFPGFDVDNWLGLFAPAGTPPAIISKLHGEVAKSLQHPAAQKLVQQCPEDLRFVGSTPAEFTMHFRREIDKYAKIIRAAGIKPEV
jgi:tripartite-type tricarboxylate transporter receptor subunit TctC